MVNIKCKICKNQFKVFPSEIKYRKVQYCSVKCRIKGSKGLLSGNKNPMWKGDKVSYTGIHAWLKINFGKANKCENPNCPKKSKYFQWSLKKGFKHSHKRENYWELCIPCHLKYDFTEERRKKISDSLKGHKN